jgi:hypothetical protein
MASPAYTLQLGQYRQKPPRTGDSSNRYASMANRSAAAAGPAAGKETSEPVDIFMVNLGLGALQDLALHDDHEIEEDVAVGTVASEALAQEPLRAVARHRRSHLASHREPEPMTRAAVRGGHQLEQRAVQPPPAAEHPAEVRGRAQAVLGTEARAPDQAVSRFRPFWRRRFRTNRPPFVRMRTRNPWVRFRFLLFGWKVLFIVEPRPPFPPAGSEKPGSKTNSVV